MKYYIAHIPNQKLRKTAMDMAMLVSTLFYCP